MSWLNKNYEKAALGGAAVVALGVAYFGWAKYSSVDADFGTGLTGKGNNQAAVRGAEKIPKAISSFKLDRVWPQGIDQGRPVDLFTGIPLFVPSSAPETAIDLLKDEPVHQPIPNTWWIENRLDPGFGDSPARDPDDDGFSNLEEYRSKTDPNNPKSFPPLIAKLMYVKDESLTWVLRPRFGAEGKFPFNYEDSERRTNRTGAGNLVAPGELFFADGVMANRFKFLGSEVVKEMNEKINLEVDVTMVRIEDQRPNKKGLLYKIPAPLAEQRKMEHVKYDRTAVFSLEALGLEGKEFKVEEYTAFALPPDSAKKDYFLKEVTPGSVTVEYVDPSGEKKTVEIPKGETPDLSE